MKVKVWKLLGLLLIVIFALSIARAQANNGAVTQSTVDSWPMFHHDLTHSGYSTSTAPTTNQTLWNYTTGFNLVDSSPAVSGGMVYFGSYDGLYVGKVYALNATTGVNVWNYTTGAEVHSSPAVSGGVVYVGSGGGKVYALNASTGALVWNYTTGGEVESSPAVAGGVVYAGSHDGKVYAFGKSTSVPEFPSFIILPLFIMATLGVMIFKRKRNVKKQSY